MERLTQLHRQKKQLLALKRTMDKNAPMHTEEGYQYARTLTKIVLINIEIEEAEKKEMAAN